MLTLFGVLVDIHLLTIDRLLLAGLRFADLIASDPDLAIGEGETEHMVYKGLDLARTLGDSEHLGEELLDESQMGLFFESSVEG